MYNRISTSLLRIEINEDLFFKTVGISNLFKFLHQASSELELRFELSSISRQSIRYELLSHKLLTTTPF
jgi:hypothetical protein